MSFLDQTKAVLGHCMAVFGELVEYRPASGDPKQIQAIFSEEWREVDPGTGLSISTTQPNLGVRLADLDAVPVDGDRVVIRGTTFKVRDVRTDGQGGALLLLHGT